GNGKGAGSSGSSDASSSSESEGPPPEGQKAKAHRGPPPPPPAEAEGESASGLITQEGIHIPFEHHIENLTAEQGSALCHHPPLGSPEAALETVVCVPVPVQMGSGHGPLFENVAREALGEGVAGCPVQGVLQGSQVIIIAGPGYDALAAAAAAEGLQLNVTSAGGEELPCAMIEGVAAAFAQAEPESQQLSTTEGVEYEGTKQENEELLELKKEEPQPPEETDPPSDLEVAGDGAIGEPEPEPEEEEEEAEGHHGSSIIYEIPKEPEKRRRSKRGRMTDADGMLEMFHCPYEGCAQVYVALSSFQNHVNLVHRKGKTKVCPHPGCGKKFYLSNHLRRHMIIHSGVLPVPAVLWLGGRSSARAVPCGLSAAAPLSSLLTLPPPCRCEICGYQCRQRASLNWHMKKHTSDVHYNFTCEHCGKRFEKLDSVKFHKLKSHPDHKAA
ncbi:PREDICTED: zinc finger protein 653, partial [Gekko japonicus]|uniref:Zinc finger protein 653 n=1 Tax=Gekko japonicus TaxID=146911 RepID=A0ABM1JI81_GEKJA